jgi:hypothetical protein
VSCASCGESLDGAPGPLCYLCLDEDEQEAEFGRFWAAYSKRQVGMLEAILAIAPRVCSDAELDVLQERLYDQDDQQIAARLDLSLQQVRRIEKEAHEKIRDALSRGAQAFPSRREAYRGIRWRKLQGPS